MKYLSLFSGIGGFEYGIDRAINKTYPKNLPKYKSNSSISLGNGWGTNSTCSGYSEIDKYAEAIYEYNFKGHKNYGDATKIDTSKLPDFDFLVGGFPCQAFSIAGKRKGFNDTRGTLFFEIARILADKRPRYFLLENVKGLLSHDTGKTFQTILGVLTDLGYEIEWQVLNSKDFGVPQNRKRVFIIGHLGGGSGREILFERIGSSQDIKTQQQVSSTIYAGYYKQGGRDQQYVKKIIDTGHEGTNIFSTDGIAPTQKALGGGQGAKTGLYAMRGRNPENPKSRKSGLPTEQMLEKNLTGNTNTLSTVQKDNVWYDGMRIRRLTPTECERLQGFPDNWTKYGIMNGEKVEISDTQRYKCLGNAVTTNVITEIFRRIIPAN